MCKSIRNNSLKNEVQAMLSKQPKTFLLHIFDKGDKSYHFFNAFLIGSKNNKQAGIKNPLAT